MCSFPKNINGQTIKVIDNVIRSQIWILLAHNTLSRI